MNFFGWNLGLQDLGMTTRNWGDGLPKPLRSGNEKIDLWTHDTTHGERWWLSFLSYASGVSHYLHIGDGHQPNSRGLYPLEGFPIKGGMTTPNENELIYPGTYLETSSWTCLGARPMAILMVLERNSWLKVSGSDESCQISPKLTSISRIATLEKKYTFARPWPSFLHIQSEFLQLSTLIYIDNFYINFDKPTIIGWLFGGRW